MKRLRLPTVTVWVVVSFLVVVAVSVIPLTPAHGDDVQPAAATADILGRLLDEVGFTRDDLGYRPRGYWSRFPLDIPYRLPSFDDLFAEPLRLFDYATTMGNAVELYLAPSYADSVDDGLYKLLHNLGVDRKLGGFRTYSANPLPAPATAEPLVTACEQLYLQAGVPLESYTFGSRSGAPSVADTVRAQTGVLPDTVRVVLAELIVNLREAVRWRDLAFRRCDRQAMQASIRLRDLASTQGDGQLYYPQLDDVAQTIDLPSLHYAGLKTAAAAERAERQLYALRDRVPPGLDCEIPTPYGAIILIAPGDEDKARSHRPRDGTRDHRRTIDLGRTLCVIDFGASCIWRGTAGSAVTIDNPVSVLIDLGGDDDYGEARTDLPPSAGVGLCGIGVVIDSDGDDHYHGSTYAQGAGLFGIGILLDRQGDDVYRAAESAQGCGYFGIGLCLDGTGDDNFYLYGDGQGMGGIGGGIGVLASWDGNDHYTAEPLAAVFDRGDYHSDHVINANNA